MSVAFAGVKLAERVFGNLDGHEALIVGAGAVAEQVAEHLRHRGIARMVVVNRSLERAGELARRVGAAAAGLESLDSLLSTPDIIVTSISGGETVLSCAKLESAMGARSGRALFLVDLGVPRNIEPSAAALYNVFLYNVDDLGEIVEQNKLAREAEIPRAEAIITEQLAKFEAWQRGVEAVAFLDRLRDRLHADRQALVRQRLDAMPQLAPEDRQRILLITEELIDEILRRPEERLRAGRFERRLEAIQVLRSLFGLDEIDKE
jgi:glutamyl-tRNA reductase